MSVDLKERWLIIANMIGKVSYMSSGMYLLDLPSLECEAEFGDGIGND